MFKLLCLLVCLIAVLFNLKTVSAGYLYTAPTTQRQTPPPPRNTYLPPKTTESPTPPPPPPATYLPPRPTNPPPPPQNTYLPPQIDEPLEPEHVHEPGMPFDFNYAVNDAETANVHNHQASSDGDVTRGEYRVLMPDGRTQVVRYTADWKNGYNAEVTYE